jgi:DNA repair exonuclease SbcCD ATPase subunit
MNIRRSIQKIGNNLKNTSKKIGNKLNEALKKVIQPQNSIISGYGIILNQLNKTRRLNKQLSSTNASLRDKDANQRSRISKLSASLGVVTNQIKANQNIINNLTAIRENLENQRNELADTNDYLQKKNVLDKTIALIKENVVLITQITNNKENYSTDFQKIFYKEQQLMQIKSVNFYLLLVYYFFVIILIYFAFFNKNNFTLYFKVFGILFLVILPLLGFFFIDVILQTLKFLWRYVISFIYGDR